MKLIDLPKHLYKFVTWDKEYHKDILKKNIIFFPSAKKFNDPFDTAIPLRYDLGTDKQIIEMYKKHLHLSDPILSPDYIEKLAKDHFDRNIIKDPKKIKEQIEFQREWAITKYGIFVLTTEFQNILMWSHYSSSHQGICIRFNTANFKSFIENECVKNNLLITWHKVKYEKKFPLLNPFELDDNEVVTKPLSIKSDDWEYENEYRFILFDKPNTLIQLPSGIIDLVFCGCKMDADNKNEIVDFARSNSIEVVQTKLKDNYFELDYEKIV